MVTLLHWGLLPEGLRVRRFGVVMGSRRRVAGVLSSLAFQGRNVAGVVPSWGPGLDPVGLSSCRAGPGAGRPSWILSGLVWLSL